MAVRVQAEDFDAGQELVRLSAGRHSIGAVVCFVGLVRDLGGEAALRAMTLEHYPGMTERQLQALEAEARQRWPLEDVLIVHRHGRLEPGAQIVLVLTASAHRQAAFESAAFLMDWLKTRAPFWKQEENLRGEAHWVDARETDDAAAARWGNLA